MKLLACEPSAFSARTAARDKVNFTLNAESMRRTAPTLQSNRVVSGVAIIDIRGVMLAAPDVLDEMFGGYTSTRTVTRQVEAAASDSSIRSILLRVDSPGGEVDGLSELGDAGRDAARRKRVIGQVEGMAASAAYYAIAGASEVVAGKMDMVGSIGTIVVVYDASEAFKSAGLRVVPITTGKYKATATLGTPLTADEEQYLRSIVDEYFDDFRRTVMLGRGRLIGPAEWSEVSDGRVFVAGDAKRLGLIDGFATFGQTLRRMQAENLSPSQRVQARVQRSLLAVGEIGERHRAETRACKQRAYFQRAELQTAQR
jgi:signal peptide peptidase SppA